jgi:peptidoglycan/LPS O-acetylase OafA/YrhL
MQRSFRRGRYVFRDRAFVTRDAMVAANRLQKLEAIRGFAAVYVVAYHLGHLYLPRRGIGTPFLFGPEAVTLFFLLSGFVIYYSTHSSPLDLIPRNYLVKRVRRIYPIFLCALLIGYLSHVVCVGRWALPSWKLLLGNLVMAQDYAAKPGVWIGTFYNNGPLWSLSYECWFYGLFIVLVDLVRQSTKHQFYAAAVSLVGIVTYLVVPNQISLFLMYFMIWWCGVELAREFTMTGVVTWRYQIVPVGMLAMLSMLWLWPLAQAISHHEHLIMNDYPVLICRHIFASIVFITLGVSWYKLRFVGFQPLLGVFALFAPMSYAIYVVHYPIICVLDHFQPGRDGLLKSAITCIVTVGLAYVLEEKMQRPITRWSKRLLVGRPVSASAPMRDPPFKPVEGRTQVKLRKAG